MYNPLRTMSANVTAFAIINSSNIIITNQTLGVTLRHKSWSAHFCLYLLLHLHSPGKGSWTCSDLLHPAYENYKCTCHCLLLPDSNRFPFLLFLISSRKLAHLPVFHFSALDARKTNAARLHRIIDGTIPEV